MNFAFLPKQLLIYFKCNNRLGYQYNIIVSNFLIVLFFLFVNHTNFINTINQIPHYCLFNKIVHIPCPFCGITRAFCCLGNGNFYTAIQWNSSSIFIALYVFLQIIVRLWGVLYLKNYKLIDAFFIKLGNVLLCVIFIIWIFKIIK